jgi:hypothetical protein
MNIALVDRRVSPRHDFKLPLSVRILKSAIAEQRTESVNLSWRGIYFPTNSPLRVGTAVQVLLKMPEEITGTPTVRRSNAHNSDVRPERLADASSNSKRGLAFNSQRRAIP